jgi:Protein of unknown function (DUF2721)
MPLWPVARVRRGLLHHVATQCKGRAARAQGRAGRIRRALSLLDAGRLIAKTCPMSVEIGSIDHLSQIISQVVAPSFLLGAVSAFISMLSGRMSVVTDRLRLLNAIRADDPDRGFLKSDIPRLVRRTRLMHRSIQLAIVSGIFTTLLIITAFATALLHYDHVLGSALLFIVSLTFFCASLIWLAADVMISVSVHDQH